MEELEINRMIKIEYDFQFENCVYRNFFGSLSFILLFILEGYYVQNCFLVFIYSNRFFYANYLFDINIGFVRQEEMRIFDYEIDLNEKLYLKYSQVCNVFFYDFNSIVLVYGVLSDLYCCIFLSSSEFIIWDKEILGKL